MPKEATVTTGVTAKSVARVRTDQRFDTTWPAARITNGETTTSRTVQQEARGTYTLPAYSMNATEPAAPAPKPITAAVRRRPKNRPPVVFARLRINPPRPLMLIVVTCRVRPA